MHFADRNALYLLLIIPFLIGFYMLLFKNKREAMQRFAASSLFERLAPALSLRRLKIKSLMLVLGFIFLIISMAGPQWGEQSQELTARGVDIFIALDCSQSMMAEDYKPNRLTVAKTVLKSLVDKLQGNRIGVIAFAGEAYIECPLTVDMSAVKMYIDELDYTTIPVQGTSLGAAITLATESFKNIEKNASGSKALILLTDGEDLERHALESARNAGKTGVRIFALGIGNPEGSPIPIKNSEGKEVAPKTDSEGKIVTSRLDEKTLNEIAHMTGGKYLRCSYSETGLNTISSQILGMDKNEYQRRLEKQYINRFQYPLALVILLLGIEFMIPDSRKVR